MNKMFRMLLYALVLASLLSSLVFTAGSAAPSFQTVTGNEAVIRFDMIGFTDTLLRGPYATVNARFGVPANWAFQTGGSLQLIVTANQVTNSNQAVADGKFIGATLNVSFNKKDIATIPLLAGSNVNYDIPIPATALVSSLNDGRHDISLFLDAGTDCTDTSRHTSIVISSTSYITMPYLEQSPIVDLTSLPRPIFQRDSIFPVTSTLVVPDAPTAQEMQAALTIASSFGRMSAGQMSMSLVPMSQLTPEMRTEAQLIFVGKSTALSILQGVALPSPIQSNKFAAVEMQPDDGILQMAVSPWNTGRAMLVVGGNSDLGVVKAAQALSNGNIQTVGNHDLALIANVMVPAGGTKVDIVPVDTHTFRDLGHDIITMRGAGRSEASVRFNIPPGYMPTEDTYLDLTFNHSGLLDFNRSGLTVFMNGNLIGSVLLSEESSSTITQRFKIPVSSLTTSTNELKFESDLAPLSQCSFLDFSNLWLSILPESALHVPLQPATAGDVSLRDLSSYPYPFASDPSLSNLGFVLPKDDPAAWNTAAQIAQHLGRQAAGAVLSISAAYDGEISEDYRKNLNLVIVGLPATNQLLAEINDSLPAPFEKGTNVPVVQGQQVSYRFPAEADLGYLQLLASPWNANRVILAVVGSSPAGVAQAGNALNNPLMLSRVKGNFVLVNGNTISVADTRTGLGLSSVGDSANVVPETVMTSGTPVPQTPESIFTTQMGWIPLVVGGLLVVIFIVLLIAALTRHKSVVHH